MISDEVKNFAIRLAALILIAPLVGLYMVRLASLAETAWKTNDRRKKWIVMSTLFAIGAGLSGWFRSF